MPGYVCQVCDDAMQKLVLGEAESPKEAMDDNNPLVAASVEVIDLTDSDAEEYATNVSSNIQLTAASPPLHVSQYDSGFGSDDDDVSVPREYTKEEKMRLKKAADELL